MYRLKSHGSLLDSDDSYHGTLDVATTRLSLEAGYTSLQSTNVEETKPPDEDDEVGFRVICNLLFFHTANGPGPE